MGSIHLFRDLPEIKAFAAGEYIFRKGEQGSTMYMIIEGDIELVVGRLVVEIAHPGAFIGEMALIDDATRSASARAKNDARVFPIDEARFQSLVEDTPSFALDVMKALALRLRRANEKVASRHAAPVRRRAAVPTPVKRKTRRTR